MKLFSELRRRNVLRMAVLYGVAAWLVMQVAEVITSLVSLPEWLGPTLITLLAIGFPIALIFSWLFEITPEGVSLEKDIPEGESITRATGRRMDFVIIAILSAGLILFAWDKWWPRGPMELSIAVLPFENMSADPEQEYFSDGISEEVLNLLAQIQPLKVIARQSSFSFKGKAIAIAAIAQQLNVRHVLEGSVRRSGDRVRITAQLIDAKDSSRLWSQTFDRDFDAENLFNIQSEIARAISDRLRMTLTGEDEARLARVPTKSSEAYSAYLLGRQRLKDRKVDDLADAVEQFARAIEFDPQFAGAYSGLVDACFLYEHYSGRHGNENCPPSAAELEGLARKAVELDPESGEAWISMARSLEISAPQDEIQRLEKLKEARSAYERGLELNPSQAQGYLWYASNLMDFAWYREPGSYWEAWKARVWQSVIAEGLEADPLSIPLHSAASNYPATAQNPEEAMLHARRIVEIAPNSPTGLRRLAEYSWSLEGRADEAIRWAHRAAQVDPDQKWFARLSAYAYSALGDYEMALAYLEMAERLLPEEERQSAKSMVGQRAFIYLHAGRTEEAVEIFESLQDDVTSWGMNYYLNALTSLDLAAGDYSKALSRYESHLGYCLEQKEMLRDWWNCPVLELARTLEATGDSASAVRLMESFLNDGIADAPEEPMLSMVEELYLIGNIGKAFLDSGKLFADGEQEKALGKIEKAVDMGYRGFAFPMGDWRFAAYYDIRLDHIRNHPRFQAAIAVIEADMAKQLENVRAMERSGELPTLEELKARVAFHAEGTTTTSED